MAVGGDESTTPSGGTSWLNRVLGKTVSSARQRAFKDYTEAAAPDVNKIADDIFRELFSDGWAPSGGGGGSSSVARERAQRRRQRQAINSQYQEYLKNLDTTLGTSRQNIAQAYQGMLSAIPTQATLPQTAYVPPPSVSNVYEQYLTSQGMSAPEVAALRSYAAAQNEAMRQQAEASALAQQNTMNEYYNNLRSGAAGMQASALQRLAQQEALLRMQALANVQNQRLGIR